MLASTLRWHIGNGAFEQFEKRLLHAFTRNISCDRDILRGLADLVDFVDVNDAALCALKIEVGSLEQFEKEVFNILADLACLGERRGVADCEGHIEHTRKGLGEQSLARSSGSDEQHIRLVEFDWAVFVLRLRESLVVIVDCDRERDLGLILTNDILVEELAQLAR